MQGLGPGRQIANRYALTERRAHLGDIEVWSAVDSTLGREVSVTLFPSSLPRAEAVLDAARRSASLNDHRLVRVLDVGSADDLNWLVEESLSESSSIADLLARGPLPPEEARRIAGEVASGLAVAARRGLHHLHITPHSVRRTDGGLIKVAGLATAAALEGTEQADPAQAERIDAVGVVALLYAAMTTRWPLRTPVAGLEPAPRIVGGVAAPSEIALAVPPDLDAVCRATLNHDTGPRTPEELVSRIAPWSHTLVRHVAPKAPATRTPRMASDSTQVIPAVRSGGKAGADDAAAGTFARVAEQHRRHKEAEKAERAAQVRRRLEERRADPTFLNLPEALEERRPTDDRPVPLLTPVPESEGRHAKLILGVVAAIIVVALAFAIPTLSHMFASSPKRATGATTSAEPARGTPSGSATGAAASPTSTAPAGRPIEITSATGFDPEGDDKENSSKADLATDGDPSTAWTSEGYDAPEYGTKKGVGLLLQVPKDSEIRQVKLDLTDSPQNVTVYVSDSRSIDSATKIDSLTDATGTQTVTAERPVTGRYVIVWVTRPAQDGDRYRATVADVAIS